MYLQIQFLGGKAKDPGLRGERCFQLALCPGVQ